MSTSSPTSSQPVGMTDILNPSEEHRDSAYYSNGEASKHTSTVSNNPPNLFSPPSYNSSEAGKTPSPTAVNVSPSPNVNMSVAAMVSPTTPSSMDNAMLAKLDIRPGYDVTQRTSAYSLDDANSRRETGSISNGFEGMRLNNGSPYHTNNQSTASIQGSLQQQRTPATPAERLSASRHPNGYQPNTIRFGSDGQKTAISRIAPPITSPPVSSIANALEPAKGQAWAFPDSNDPPSSKHTSYLDSRRSSVADSLASSQFTTESRLPPGQRRLDEGYPGDFNRLSRASSEYHGPSYHQHSLQHKQLGELRDEDAGSPGNGQPYSRTPELRVSHKLAERKRRNEMKELYDELRDLMPQERGSKASKWEILSKAIQEHKRQEDLIRQLEMHCRVATNDLQRTREELVVERAAHRELRARQEQGMVPQSMHHAPAPLQHMPQPPASIDPYTRDQYSRGLPMRSDRRAELPPLSSIGSQMQPPPDAMSGVTYQLEAGQGTPYGSRPSTSNYQGPQRI